MEDLQIIELFFQRSEEAVSQTDRKYGRFCGALPGGFFLSRRIPRKL